MANKQVQIGTEGTTKFWMVWVIGRGGPGRTHATLALAAAEADRLSSKTKRTAFVLEGIGAVIPDAKPPDSE